MTSSLEKGWRFIAENFHGIEVGRGATVNYENYFKKLNDSVTVPFYKDTDKGAGLDPNSVYIYRVRVVYEDGSAPDLWLDKSKRAAKTLDGSAIPSGQVAPICKSNSFCDGTITGNKVNGSDEKSEIQCRVNADCINVGRSSKTFQER